MNKPLSFSIACILTTVISGHAYGNDAVPVTGKTGTASQEPTTTFVEETFKSENSGQALKPKATISPAGAQTQTLGGAKQDDAAVSFEHEHAIEDHDDDVTSEFMLEEVHEEDVEGSHNLEPVFK